MRPGRAAGHRALDLLQAAARPVRFGLGTAWRCLAGPAGNRAEDARRRRPRGRRPRRGPVDAQLEALFGHTQAGELAAACVIGPRYPVLQNCDPGDPGSGDPGDPDGDPRQTCVYLVKVLKDGRPQSVERRHGVPGDGAGLQQHALSGGADRRHRRPARPGRRFPHRIVLRGADAVGEPDAGDDGARREGRSLRPDGCDRRPGRDERGAECGRDPPADRRRHRPRGDRPPSDETLLVRVCVAPVDRLRGDLLGRLGGLAIDPSVARPRLDVLALRGSAPTVAAAARGNCRSTDCMRALALPDLVDAVGKGEAPSTRTCSRSPSPVRTNGGSTCSPARRSTRRSTWSSTATCWPRTRLWSSNSTGR